MVVRHVAKVRDTLVYHWSVGSVRDTLVYHWSVGSVRPGGLGQTIVARAAVRRTGPLHEMVTGQMVSGQMLAVRWLSGAEVVSRLAVCCWWGPPHLPSPNQTFF